MLYRFGECELDTARFELRREGTCVQIEPQAFDLLRYLVERPDTLISKEELFNVIWCGRTVSDAALSSRIKTVRRAIGDTGRDQRFIRTLHGRGFRFVGRVDHAAEPDISAADVTVEEPVAVADAVQEIRYCNASDGVSIAYAISGRGAPIIKTANWLNHLQLDWRSPLWLHWLNALAAENTLLRYDERGTGLSAWSVNRITFDDLIDDLEAVVDSAGIEKFALLGISQGCAVSVAYAVRHPSRVTHLVLCGGYVQGWHTRGDAHEIARREAIETLIREGWGQENPTFRQIFTSLMIPEGSPEQVEWFNDMMKASASAENAVRLHDAFGRVDVAHLISQVRAPTLVVHSRNDQVAPFEQGKALAAGIPGARLLPLDSKNHLLMAGEPAWPVFVNDLKRFLDS
jgi:DNA-binding winged helix-turn-helix (wHTH) protein/pimeloyl-ACP methyl ester carboxylesterase